MPSIRVEYCKLKHTTIHGFKRRRGPGIEACRMAYSIAIASPFLPLSVMPTNLGSPNCMMIMYIFSSGAPSLAHVVRASITSRGWLSSKKSHICLHASVVSIFTPANNSLEDNPDGAFGFVVSFWFFIVFFAFGRTRFYPPSDSVRTVRPLRMLMF